MPNCGRQTEVLEHVNPYSVAADEQKSLSSLGGATHPLLDGPTIDDVPIKKPKLEPVDVDMETNAKHVSNVSPGDPIASATQPDPEQNLDLDVDIPRLEQADSPSLCLPSR